MTRDADPAVDDEARLSILQIGTQFNLGGIPRHMIGLTRALRDQGHEITLAGNSGTWCGPDSDPTFLELPIRYVASEGGALHKRIVHLAVSVHRLRRWLKRHPVDLIHAHESAPALVAMLARIGRRVPVAVTYHGAEPERVLTFSRTARKCDLVITPSHRSAEDLATTGGVPRERLQVIGLGLDPAPEDSPEEIAALRAKLLGDGERLIVTVARLAHQKGIEILIDCVARLKGTHPGYRFILVGTGPLGGQYKALAKEKGVLSHLNFVGRTERVHLYLRAADLFLLTSRWEALPFTIAEAFQAGTPAVATACSGVVELIDDAVGAVVPVGDIPAICDAVARVLGDEERRAAMADAALARSREDRFDPDYIRKQFETAYRKLIASEPLQHQ